MRNTKDADVHRRPIREGIGGVLAARKRTLTGGAADAGRCGDAGRPGRRVGLSGVLTRKREPPGGRPAPPQNQGRLLAPAEQGFRDRLFFRSGFRSYWSTADESRPLLRSREVTEPTPERHPDVRVGCAGWSIPKEYAGRFPADGHPPGAVRRAAASRGDQLVVLPAPPAGHVRPLGGVGARTDFRFAVKVPREVTHHRRLAAPRTVLDRFLGGGRRSSGASSARCWCSCRRACRSRPPWPGSSSRRCGSGSAAPWRASRGTGAGSSRGRAASWRSSGWPASPPTRPWSRRPRSRAGGAAWCTTACTGRRGCTTRRTRTSTWTLSRAGSSGRRRSAAVWCIFDNTALGAATANALQVLEWARTG